MSEEASGQLSPELSAKIAECFADDRSFHEHITNKQKYTQLLSYIGDMPFNERGLVAKSMHKIIDTNPRLLQDNGVFSSIIQILKQIPESLKDFQELAGKVMLKLREALIKNQKALNLYHKPMADYSATIREFLALIPAKPKNSFLNSFDQNVLDFIMGKVSKEQREKRNKEMAQRQAETPFDDDEEDDDRVSGRMQQLVKMMFEDVMRLEPDLVSAAILSLISQLPHGGMIIDDKKIRNDIMRQMNV